MLWMPVDAPLPTQSHQRHVANKEGDQKRRERQGNRTTYGQSLEENTKKQTGKDLPDEKRVRAWDPVPLEKRVERRSVHVHHELQEDTQPPVPHQ
jgi:hypothetical protein